MNDDKRDTVSLGFPNINRNANNALKIIAKRQKEKRIKHIPEYHLVQVKYWRVDISNCNERTIHWMHPEGE